MKTTILCFEVFLVMSAYRFAISSPDIECNPTFWNYGNIVMNSSSNQVFVIKNAGETNLDVTSTTMWGLIDGSETWIAIDGSEFIVQSGGGAFTLAPGETRTISIQFKPASPGFKWEQLRIASNDPDENPFSINLRGVGLNTVCDIYSIRIYGMQPQAMNFRPTNVGQVRLTELSIYNVGNLNLEVTSVAIIGANASDFLFMAELRTPPYTLGPAQEEKYSVRFQPTSPGIRIAALRFISNDPDENPYDIALTGMGISENGPDIDSNSSGSWNYGDVSIGGTGEKIFTLYNTGNADLIVTNTRFVGADPMEFSIESGGGAFTLGSGKERYITVHFNPTSPGYKAAWLQFESNDPDENPFRIGLSGTVPGGTTAFSILVDGMKDNFYSQLTGPDNGYIQIPHTMYNGNGAPANEADLSAKVWTAWDDTYFYLYEEVKDDTVQITNATNWQDDCIELKLDPDLSKKATTGVVEVALSALDTADVARAFVGGVNNLYASTGFSGGKKGDYARKRTADGYVLELRLKWTSMVTTTTRRGPIVPAVGGTFGLAINQHDNDKSARQASVQWAAVLDDAVWSNPTLHGTVEFLAGNKLKLMARNSTVPTNVNADAWAYVPGTDPWRIAIDARRDPWYGMLAGPDEGRVHIPFFMHNDNGAPDNDADLSADLWVAWDADYLYVYEEVKDNVVHLNNPTKYQNDCLEIYFDPDPSLKKITGPTGFGLSALDSADVANPANLSGVAEMKAFASFAGVTKADYGRRLTADGYALECRVKWDWIQWPGWGPPVPAVGNIFGMAVMNHDNDVSQREGSIEWAAVLKDAVWNDTQLHGTVTLLADHRLKLEAKNAIVPANVNADAWAYVPGADTGIEEITASDAAPAMFSLGQNYPNPFNSTTSLTYNLPRQTKVKIVIYDILGREIETLVNEVEGAGRYTIQFDASKVDSGVYLCSLFYDKERITRKIMLLK